MPESSTAGDVKRSLRAQMTLLRCGHPGCNYSSARKNNLARHQRTHSGEPTLRRLVGMAGFPLTPSWLAQV